MEGKTCLITGGSDGIGYVAAREMARMGATVVIAGRNATKTATAVAHKGGYWNIHEPYHRMKVYETPQR